MKYLYKFKVTVRVWCEQPDGSDGVDQINDDMRSSAFEYLVDDEFSEFIESEEDIPEPEEMGGER